MTIEVFARSNNHVLFEMMRSFLPASIEVHEITGFHGFEESAGYLYHIIDQAEEMCVNIDIDCFVHNFSELYMIAEQMKAFEFTHYGIRDGGVIPHRKNSWAVMNPFLNVFNAPLIRGLKGPLSWDQIGKWQPDQGWKKPINITDNHRHNFDEPYSGLFYWLYGVGSPIFESQVKTCEDGITTMGNYFMHTWYSRDYDTDPEQKARINDRFLDAKNLAS